MKKKSCKSRLCQFLRCVIMYNDINHVRSLHFAVNPDYVDSFLAIIHDTFVNPDVQFTDIIYSYDERDFFSLI